jgi:alkyl sulfatase BDS1-like metallo-beta-lactamase superfamily hydrolase
MQEFFGSVHQAVRGIYQDYLGWFEGDSVALDPVPPKARDARWRSWAGGTVC